jgi:hypothetical protein
MLRDGGTVKAVLFLIASFKYIWLHSKLSLPSFEFCACDICFSVRVLVDRVYRCAMLPPSSV